MLNACHARLGEQYNCDSIQVTMNCDTWRCQRACHQFLLNAFQSHSSGLGKLLNAQPGTLCKTHLSVKRSEGGQLPRYGQQYPVVKGLRPGADLLNLRYRRLWSGSKGNMRLDMAVFAWEQMMHEQDACNYGPQTLWPSCQRWQTRNHPTGRATDICPW